MALYITVMPRAGANKTHCRMPEEIILVSQDKIADNNKSLETK